MRKGYRLLNRLFGKKRFQYRCEECGELHKGSPSFSFRFPTYIFDVPEDERENRVDVTDDVCHIKPAQDDNEGEDIFCIRVILEIPIEDADQPFSWGVWVTQSKDSFDRYVETFDQDQSSLKSFGWLPVVLPYYNLSDAGDPLHHLECDIQWGTKGQRPRAFLWENSHPLAVDQREGITWLRAVTIANLTNKALSCESHVVQ